MNRGAFVNALDARAVRDNYDLFGLVYGFAAQRALDRSGPELLRRLRELKAGAATKDPVELGAVATAVPAPGVASPRSPQAQVPPRGKSSPVPRQFFARLPHAMPVWTRGTSG